MVNEILLKAAQQGVLLYLQGDGLGFKAKKGGLDTSLRTQIKDNKEAIITLLRSTKELKTHYPEIERVSRQETLPMSFAQQRLWLLDQLDGGSSHYNMPMVLRLQGGLNINVLTQAFNTIVARHESLRTVFRMNASDEPEQVINSAKVMDIPLFDLSELESSQQNQSIESYMAAEANKVFDLSEDQMIRVQLLQLGNEDYIVLVTMHHVSSDGWSSGILVNEFSALYQAFVQGKADPLPELEIQYADYAHWQRGWLQGDVLAQQLGYWQQQLTDLPIVHSLPLDKPRPTVQSFAGNFLDSIIGHDTYKALNNLCQKQGATLFMGLHAAFSVLLARYSNETDIVIGSPVANREQAEVASLIGFFVNMLVLRSDLSMQPSFSQLLEQSKRMLLEAYAHQQVPFEQIVDRLQPERSMSHSPLFQVMLVMQNNEESELQLPGLNLSSMEHEGTIAKYDLTLLVTETEKGLHLGWEYNTDLFAQDTIVRLAGHFSELLTSLVNTPQENVFEVNLLSETERFQQLQTWNHTPVDYPQDVCIHELFVAQVLRTPDDIALIDVQGDMSYLDLYSAVTDLAVDVAEYIDQSEELVAVRLPKGRDQLIATLAIMMVGAAYLPLECDWPDERCSKIVRRAGVKLLLIDNGDDALEVSGLAVMSLTKNTQSLFTRENYLTAAKNFKAKQQATELAYIIFTSGSTGEPKGVAVEHASVVNTLLDINARFDINNRDRVLAVSALSFDLSVYDFFGLLAIGGVVVFPEDEQAKNPEHWLAMVELHQITIWNTVPVSMGLLLEQLESLAREAGAPLRRVLMSGDWIAPDIPARIWNRFKNCLVYSLGGATEGSIWSIYYPIIEDTSHLTSIPYGKPLGGQTFYVFNHVLEPCPVGVTGELFIGGRGVVREYFGDPEQTKKQFIWHPKLQQKLYRTGDTGRYLADGNIQFKGRVDNQLKIRGFRVELGEIEKTLSSHETVKETVVIARDSESYGKQLIAYVVAEDKKFEAEQQAYSDLLLQFLNQQLPYYMVPATFMLLSNLPLTANGKVDRKKLPEPDLSLQQGGYIAPESDTELLLANIWIKLLGFKQIGVRDNFFYLGGHSLLATRLVSEINRARSLGVGLGDVFSYPVLADLASFLETKIQPTLSEAELLQSELSESEMVIKFNEAGRDKNLFFIHPGAGIAHCYQYLASLIAEKANCYGISCPLIYGQEMYSDFSSLIEVYVKLIKKVQPEGKYYLVGYSSGGVIAFEIARQLKMLGNEAIVGLVDSFATLEDYEIDDKYWYSPVKEALENVLLIKFDYDWSLLNSYQVEGGMGVLAHAIKNNIKTEYISQSDIKLVREYLYHFYKLHRLKSDHQLSQQNIPCVLFKAAEPSEFNLLFSDFLGWDQYCSSGLEKVLITGKHENLVDAPSADFLSRELIKMLTKY